MSSKNGMKFMSQKWCHKMHSHTPGKFSIPSRSCMRNRKMLFFCARAGLNNEKCGEKIFMNSLNVAAAVIAAHFEKLSHTATLDLLDVDPF
jgi:hypothetical protein